MKRLFLLSTLALVMGVGCDQKEVSIPETTEKGGTSVEVSRTYRIEGPKQGVSANTASKTELIVKAREGFDVNPEFPWKFSFSTDGVTTTAVSKEEIKFQDGKASIPFEVNSKAGDLKVIAEGSFSICKKGDRGVCYFVRDEPLQIQVAVNE